MKAHFGIVLLLLVSLAAVAGVNDDDFEASELKAENHRTAEKVLTILGSFIGVLVLVGVFAVIAGLYISSSKAEELCGDEVLSQEQRHMSVGSSYSLELARKKLGPITLVRVVHHIGVLLCFVGMTIGFILMIVGVNTIPETLSWSDSVSAGHRDFMKPFDLQKYITLAHAMVFLQWLPLVFLLLGSLLFSSLILDLFMGSILVVIPCLAKAAEEVTHVTKNCRLPETAAGQRVPFTTVSQCWDSYSTYTGGVVFSTAALVLALLLGLGMKGFTGRVRKRTFPLRNLGNVHQKLIRYLG